MTISTDASLHNEMDVAAEHRLYRAMRHFWHPVLYASDLPDDEPRAATLLGEPLVLARLGGQVRCFPDLCVHRGAALSLGFVEGDQLRCLYHGWTYGPDGKCTAIPARFGRSIPNRARLKPYHVQERNGLIWVCPADQPEFDPPEFPEYGNPDFVVLQGPAYDWESSAHRRVENFVDFAHFAWVHDGVLGRRDNPEVPDHPVWREGSELRFTRTVREPAEGVTEYKDLTEQAEIDVEYNYRLTMPLTAYFDRHFLPAEDRYVLIMTASPLAADKCRSFWFLARNYAKDREDQPFIDFERLVQEQDRPVVESQRPELLPYDLSAELHIRGVDQVSLEYRRWLVELTNELEPKRSD